MHPAYVMYMTGRAMFRQQAVIAVAGSRQGRHAAGDVGEVRKPVDTTSFTPGSASPLQPGSCTTKPVFTTGGADV
jgi:hypothetical protein